MTLGDKLSYSFVFSIPLLVSAGYISGQPILGLSLLGGWYLVAMVLEAVCGRETSVSIHEVREIDNTGQYAVDLQHLLLYAYVVLHLCLLAVSIYHVAFVPPTAAWFLYAVPIGLSGAVAVGISHETLHTSHRVEKFIAHLAAIPAFYSVHEYEHLYRHHNDDISCTSEDTTCARRGQSFYPFAMRMLIGTYYHGWQIQRDRLHQDNRSAWSLANPLIRTVGSSVLLGLAIGVVCGSTAVLFYLAQALVSSLSFILFTYNQHYGLIRRKLPDGRDEAFSFMNIWSSDRYFTARMAFGASRHAHHHLFPFCHYYKLRIIDGSPILPAGYFTIALVSLIPPLWRRLMDARVDAVFERRDALDSQGLL